MQCFFLASNGDFDQTARMRRLTCSFHLTRMSEDTFPYVYAQMYFSSSPEQTFNDPSHDKTYNKTCDQRILRSACASALSDQSVR